MNIAKKVFTQERYGRLSRRSALRSGGATALLFPFLTAGRSLAATRIAISITEAAYGGKGDGTTDNTAAFNAAFTALTNGGGGSLSIPPGTYILNGAATYTGGNPISIIGSGKGVSIISIPPGGSGIYINPSNQTPPPITISGLSFNPNGTSTINCTALKISYQQSGSGIYGNVAITDVDFGVGMGSSFQTSLLLSNIGQSVIRGLQVHCSNGTAASGSTGVALQGVTDVRFEDATVSNVDIGFGLLDANSQGLHIDNAVIICNTGITTQLAGSNPSSSNILGLYISNSEIDCFLNPAILYLVNTAWISNTHFGIANSGSGLQDVMVIGSENVQFSNCSFTGQFNNASPANYIGVYTGRASNGNASSTIQIHSCQFQNIGTGVYFDSGTYLSSAEGVQVNDYNGNLVGNGTAYTGEQIF